MNTRSIRGALGAGLALYCLAVTAVRGAFDNDDVRQALQSTARDVADSLRGASAIPASAAVAILPLGGDEGKYVEGLLKNAVTGAGKTCVEGKDDPLWEEILKEIVWDGRKSDMLDPATLTAFGKLKGVKVLLYGQVRSAGVSGHRVFVEIELHASSIETRQHLWGDVFVKRVVLPNPDEIIGLLNVPAQVREPLRTAIQEKAAAALKEQEGKLQAVRSVALVPLAGDLDRYATWILRDAITKTRLNAKELDLRTLGEARGAMRDQPQQADALLYGALRDLSKRRTGYTWRSQTYEVQAEVQTCIENAATHDILWSATLPAVSSYSDTLTLWQVLVEKVVPAAGRHPLGASVIVGVVLVLIVLRVLYRMSRRAPR
jgi:hypothetical protein